MLPINIVACAPESAIAGVGFTDLFVSESYLQTGPTAVNLAPNAAYLLLSVDEQSPTDFNGFSLSYPGPASPATLSLENPPILFRNGSYIGATLTSPPFATIAELNSAFPFGVYSLTATNSSTSTSQSVSFNYDQNHLPNAIPALTATSYSNIQGMNPAAPSMFSVNGFSGDGHYPYGNDFVDPSAQLIIYDHATGIPVYSSPPAIDTTGANFRVPANSLMPGTTYNFAIDFDNAVFCGAGLACGQNDAYVLEGDYETVGRFTTAAVAVAPQTLVDFQGGTPQNPVPLPLVGQIGELNGTIGGFGSSDFYEFYWRGGFFEATIDVAATNPSASYDFELLDPSSNFNRHILLDEADNFTATMGYPLAAGLFEIGIAASNPLDPRFTLEFETPVQGIPEPQTVGLAVLGFACLALSRRRPRPANAHYRG